MASKLYLLRASLYLYSNIQLPHDQEFFEVVINFTILFYYAI